MHNNQSVHVSPHSAFFFSAVTTACVSCDKSPLAISASSITNRTRFLLSAAAPFAAAGAGAAATVSSAVGAFFARTIAAFLLPLVAAAPACCFAVGQLTLCFSEIC